jgi:glycine cleavage system H protein
MPSPADRKYSESHEWHKVEGDLVVIGITQHAVDELTDITYVQLPAKGKAVTAGKNFGEIESVKATAELYSGVTGEVAEQNAAVIADPSLVNQDPFGKGWLIKVKAPGADLSKLMDAAAYNAKYS